MLHNIGAIVVLVALLSALLWTQYHQELVYAICRLRVWAIGLFISLIVIYIIETNLPSEDSLGINLWLQVLTGNWSPGDAKTAFPLSERPFLFSVSVVLAVIVNLGVLVGIAQVLRRQITAERRVVVRIANLLLTRDLSIKNHLYNAFPNLDKQKVIDIVNNAFEEGENYWKRNLEDIEPKEVADEIRQRIDRNKVKSPEFKPDNFFS